jgi:hypothetical protein
MDGRMTDGNWDGWMERRTNTNTTITGQTDTTDIIMLELGTRDLRAL